MPSTISLAPAPAAAVPVRATAAATAEEKRVAVRIVRTPALLEQLQRQRRAVYAANGVTLHDEALDAQRRYGTTVGLFLDEELVGGFSVWRLSEALCSLGYLLAGVGVERHDPGRVVELASMFILPRHGGRGYARALLEHGRTLLAAMQPELLVAFAVRAVADRYIHQLGFQPVGGFVRHPLAPAVEVVPLVLDGAQFARLHCA